MIQKRRAKKIRKALRAIYGLNEPTETLIIDALTDIRHLCDFAKLDLSNCDRIAHGHYLIESSDQSTPALLS